MQNSKCKIQNWGLAFIALAIFHFSLSIFNCAATSYTEFYINPNPLGTNVNAGSTATGAATYTSRATAAGGWNGTTVFTPDDGSTPASTVSAGMFASIFTNGVNTNAIFVSRITSVAAGVNGAITVDATAKLGTAPAAVTGAGAAIMIRVGGTWTGPSTNAAGGASVVFPFGFMGPNATNAAGNMACYNWIGGTNYNTSNAITHSVNGPYRIEGYTNSPHDGGIATLSGGKIVAAYNLLTSAAARVDWAGMKFQNNGASGSSVGVVLTGTACLWQRCIFTGMGSSGLDTTAQSIYSECEFSTNNTSNAASRGGVANHTALTLFNRCYFHDNTGGNTSGAYSDSAAMFINCIFARNGLKGVNMNTTADPLVVIDCDFYGNFDAGFDMTGALPAASQLLYMENCNFVTNGTFGLNSTAAGSQFRRNGALFNLGFGTGTRTNSSGSVGAGLSNLYTNSFVNYASGLTPWVAPDTGDFRLNLGTALNTGRGAFLSTAVGYTNNLAGYPDIGAAQHQPAGAGGSFVFSQ